MRVLASLVPQAHGRAFREIIDLRKVESSLATPHPIGLIDGLAHVTT